MKIVKEIESLKHNGSPISLQILTDDWASYCVCEGSGHYFQTLDEANDYIRMRYPRKRALTYDKQGKVVALPLIGPSDVLLLEERESFLSVLLKQRSRFQGWKVEQFPTFYATKVYKQEVVLIKGDFLFEVFAFFTNKDAVGVKVFNLEKKQEKTTVLLFKETGGTILDEIDQIVEKALKEDKPNGCV